MCIGYLILSINMNYNCSLCDRVILSETQGFAQLPCNHYFHIRCLVPACDNYYNMDGRAIECRICKTEKIALEAAEAVEDTEDEEPTLAAVATAAVPTAAPVVDDAYQIVDTKMKGYIDREKKRIIAGITDEDKNVMLTYIQLLKEYKKANRDLNKMSKQRVNEFRNDVKHLVTIFNDIFRDKFDAFLNSEEFKSYTKILKKVHAHRFQIEMIYERLIGNDNSLREMFVWFDLYDMIECKEFKSVNDHYIPYGVSKVFFSHRFNMISYLYDLSKKRSTINKLFRENPDSEEEAEAESEEPEHQVEQKDVAHQLQDL